MVEEAGLPNIANFSAGLQYLGQRLLEQTDKIIEFRIMPYANKQMDMVGHDYETAYRPALALVLVRIGNKGIENFLPGKQRFAVQGIERHEIQGRVVFLKNLIKSGRCILDFSQHTAFPFQMHSRLTEPTLHQLPTL